MHPDDFERCLATYVTAFDLRQPFSMEYRLRRADGQYRWLLDNGIPLVDDTIFSGYIGSCTDISERKQAEDNLLALHASLEKRVEERTDELNAILISLHHEIGERQQAEASIQVERDQAKLYLDVAGVMLTVLNRSGEIILINPKGCAILGYSAEAIIGQNWFEVCLPAENREATQAVFAQIMAGNIHLVEYHENQVLTQSGELRLLAFHNTAFYDPNGQIAGVLFSGEDITERQQTEEQLKHSLHEKTVMLKEIHHRVKNNMQVVYSILSLQARRISEPSYRTMFEESKNRVMSMAMIHENLYQAKDLAHIDFNSYLQGLVNRIVETYKCPQVKIVVAKDSIPLDINVGIPCGLIVNELVSNCLKYAFPEGRTGTITVAIRHDSEGNNVLSVADDGIGFPAELDFNSTSQSFGLSIVKGLSKQIDGQIELSREAGTKFSITFPATSPNHGA